MKHFLKTPLFALLVLAGGTAGFLSSGCDSGYGSVSAYGSSGGYYYGAGGYYDPWYGGPYYGGGNVVIVGPPHNYNRPTTLPARVPPARPR